MSCNEWQKVKLGDLIESISVKHSFNKNKLIFLNTSDILEGKVLHNNYSDIEGLPGQAKKSIKKDDILFSEIRPKNKRFAYVDFDSDDYVVSTKLMVLRKKSNNINNRYLYYYLTSDKTLNYLQTIAEGRSGTFPQITFNELKIIEIDLPPIEEQEKIANILSSLDDKIELNNKMKKTLEEMAQSLFKRWFVDFEFSNENGEPYKSSGGEMVDSELGMIPKGWEVKCIYDLAEYINGTSFKAKDYSEKGLPIIKIAELKNGITDGTKFFSGEKDKKFYLKNGDILFSWSGNPDTSIDTFIWDKGDAILNQHIFKVIPKFDKGYAFTYLMLKYLKSTFTHIARNKQTTGLGHVTVKDLKELKIALCFSKIKEFNEVAEPMVDLIFENNMSIEQLNKIRDSLLPKLMSGEIKV